MTEDALTAEPNGGNQATEPAAELATIAPSGGGITADLVKLALRRVKDPDVNLNIVDMGLIYDVRIDGNDVVVDMSLTTPACPSGPEIMKDAEDQLKTLDGVGKVEINLVWSPPWGPQRIEPRVRTYLGF
ncbi:MAG: metal-sulfur cluster assembly factor [Gemmatimonadetes bacterium]|nr:metal-sulfur cluster assembly factor [Gemmatimonadota bacterium]